MQSVERLLARARADTGLEDFGQDSFREGLEVLVRALQQEARLNVEGEQFLTQNLLGLLKRRLGIEHWYRLHPEIDEVRIEAPLFGISLPRTGSTALSFLLAEDPAARLLRRSDTASPAPAPEVAGTAGPSGGATPALGMQRPAGLRSFVPSAADGPQECQELMALDFRSHLFQAFAQIPSYSQWLLRADLDSTYRYERRVLRLLQWRGPQRAWRLKCPTHLLFLESLERAFPDARFVMTHRDPAEVIPSVVDLYANYVARFTEHPDHRYLAELNVEHWSAGIRRALHFRADGREHRFFDIHFQAMQRDPIGEVRRLYDWLGQSVSREFADGMTRWWQHNERTREPAAHPDAVSYGLNLDELQPLFADYLQCVESWTGIGAGRTGPGG